MKTLLPVAVAFILFVSLAFAQNHSVTIVWSWAQGAGDLATGFHILRSATTGGPYSVVGTVPVTVLTYTDTTVVAGSKYFYTVTAFDAAGDSAPGNEVSVTIPFQTPTAPTGISATAK